ncbi:hypothetical protein B0H14DRAFT_3174878 [Mycena olivaceomarginata]|nr:hypothetical protein B0H14DRAFT_3174878 [Mycena olivaceomarginata]
MARIRTRTRSTESFSRNWCRLCLGGIFLVLMCFAMIDSAISGIQATLLIEQELLSRINENTPISGFYGPGTWWAWLITLGMTHGHTLVGWLNGEEQRAEWDYDLIGASAYMVAAAIDLMHKARGISWLGDKAGESMLLPALICAERVVGLGTGSSMFSIAAAVCRGGSWGRTVGVALIPLIFAVVASGFAANAHDAIKLTDLVIWCRLHNGIEIKRNDVPSYFAVDFPATMGSAVSAVFQIWMFPGFWLATGAMFAFLFVCTMVQHHGMAGAFRSSAYTALGSFALCSLVPLSGAYIAVQGTAKWVGFWLALWLPIYILAWFPTMGSFPPTGMSVLEMDQIAPLLGIVVVAMIRGFRPVWKARHFGGHFSSDSSHELSPLLSRHSNSSAAGEEVDITDINIYEVDNPVQI